MNTHNDRHALLLGSSIRAAAWIIWKALVIGSILGLGAAVYEAEERIYEIELIHAGYHGGE